MNFNFYIFGNPEGEYRQFPQDYISDVLTPFCEDVTGSRAVIYRHMELVHYIFIEAVGEGRYVGLCLIFNSVRSRYPKRLFEFMGSVLENDVIEGGRFLEYSSSGEIRFKESEFCNDVKSYDYLKDAIATGLDGEDDRFGFEGLPTKYSGDNKVAYLESTASDEAILKLSKVDNRVVIGDNHGIRRNPTYRIIEGLRGEIADKSGEISRLNRRISSLEKQKSQYRKVVALFVVLLCCCGGLYFLYDSLNSTERDLRAAEEELSAAGDTIIKHRDIIAALHNETVMLNSELDKEKRLREDAQKVADKVKRAADVIITGGSFSFGNSEYTCDYFASESGSKSLRIKVIEESTGNVYETRNVSPYLDEGIGTFRVYFNRRMSGSNWYTFEVWDGSRLIGGSRH